jgi:hypothetical protein
MAGRVVEKEEALSIALGEAFEDVDGMVDLSEKIVCVEVPIAVFARLEDDSGFPGGCEGR